MQIECISAKKAIPGLPCGVECLLKPGSGMPRFSTFRLRICRKVLFRRLLPRGTDGGGSVEKTAGIPLERGAKEKIIKKKSKLKNIINCSRCSKNARRKNPHRKIFRKNRLILLCRPAVVVGNLGVSEQVFFGISRPRGYFAAYEGGVL